MLAGIQVTVQAHLRKIDGRCKQACSLGCWMLSGVLFEVLVTVRSRRGFDFCEIDGRAQGGMQFGVLAHGTLFAAFSRE